MDPLLRGVKPGRDTTHGVLDGAMVWIDRESPFQAQNRLQARGEAEPAVCFPSCTRTRSRRSTVYHVVHPYLTPTTSSAYLSVFDPLPCCATHPPRRLSRDAGLQCASRGPARSSLVGAGAGAGVGVG